MANYTHRKRTVTEYRWELPLPHNAVELDKAVSEAYDWTIVHGLPDDALRISVEGDDILVISFTVEEK